MVIGALLVLALLSSLAGAYRLVWAPVLAEQQQADHMDLVTRQMTSLVGAMHDLVEGNAQRTFTAPLSVGLQDTRHGAIPHDLLVRNGTAVQVDVGAAPAGGGSGQQGFKVNSGTALILEKDGENFRGLDESFTEISGTDTETNVGTIYDFRIQLTEVDQNYNLDNVSLEIKDANNDLVGRFTVYVSKSGTETLLYVRVKNSTNGVLFNQPIGFHGTITVGPYWIDTMDPDYRFRKLIQGAEAPLSITFTEFNGGGNTNELNHALQGAYSVAYADHADVEEGLDRQDQGGEPSTNYGFAVTTEYMGYRAVNPDFVDQELWIDQGALIKRQGDNAWFHSAPGLRVAKSGANVTLTWSIPAINGTEGVWSSTGAVGVRLAQQNYTSLKAWLESPTLNITTPFPSTWSDHLNTTFQAAGIPGSWYSVTNGPTWVALTVDGDQSVTQDYHTLLTLRYSRIRLGVDA